MKQLTLFPDGSSSLEETLDILRSNFQADYVVFQQRQPLRKIPGWGLKRLYEMIPKLAQATSFAEGFTTVPEYMHSFGFNLCKEISLLIGKHVPHDAGVEDVCWGVIDPIDYSEDPKLKILLKEHGHGGNYCRITCWLSKDNPFLHFDFMDRSQERTHEITLFHLPQANTQAADYQRFETVIGYIRAHFLGISHHEWS